MDQGRDGVPSPIHPAGHVVEHRDPRSGDRPQDTAGLAAYWLLIRVGSGAIRREVLRIVAHHAESVNGRRPGKSQDGERWTRGGFLA